MEGEVIKSFLVGLGFEVDDSSLAKFNSVIKTAAVRVTALYASVQLAAAGIFKAISGIADSFEEMGYNMRLVAPTLNKFLILRQEMLKAYGAAGINLVKVVQQSLLFNISLAKTKIALEAIYKSVGAKFLPSLTKQMDIFRSKIYANMPKIQQVLERMVKTIFRLFEGTLILGARLWSILSRIYDFFVKLDKATDGWSTRILAFAAAWRILNLSFLATPLGAVIGGLVALLALWDDFKVWQEGGKSLFNWEKWEPAINSAIRFGENFIDILKLIFQNVFLVIKALNQLFHLDFSGFWESVKQYASNALSIFSKLFDRIKGLIDLISKTTPAALGSIAGITAIGNPYFNQSSFAAPPVNPTTAGGSVVNQSINQETKIDVNGSADANAIGKRVLDGQNGVNRNLGTNLRKVNQ